MSKINCRNVRREIEEVALGNLLSASASDHLRDCAQCSLFREDRLKLRELLSSLDAVEAPGDFDFRLRARLANEKRGAGQPFMMRNLSFGFRSVAVVAALVLVGSAVLFAGLRNLGNDGLSASGNSAPASVNSQAATNPEVASSGPAIVAGIPPKTDEVGAVDDSKVVREKAVKHRRTGYRRNENLALHPNPGVRDLGIAEARVLRAPGATSSRVFPIGASFQSLKVSLADAQGSSRTISLPSVSFGSQRVLSPTPASLVASARSDW